MGYYDIKIDKLPDEYDINYTKIEKAFNQVKSCPFCNNDLIKMSYGNNIGDETIFELFNTKHYIYCDCRKCGAHYHIDFKTKHGIDLTDKFAELVYNENIKPRIKNISDKYEKDA